MSEKLPKIHAPVPWKFDEFTGEFIDSRGGVVDLYKNAEYICYVSWAFPFAFNMFGLIQCDIEDGKLDTDLPKSIIYHLECVAEEMRSLHD